MITEFVSEKLVQRKFEGKAVAIFAAKLAGIFLAFMLAPVYATLRYNIAIGMLAVIMIPLGVWLMVRTVKSTRVEYEYTFFNGTLTIDKIINMENRKSLFDMDVTKVEKCGDFDRATFNMHGVDFLGNYSATDAMTNAYFLQYKSSTGKTNVIVLEKDDKDKGDDILDSMRRYIPQMVYREGFGKYGK